MSSLRWNANPGHRERSAAIRKVLMSHHGLALFAMTEDRWLVVILFFYGAQ